MMTPNNIKIQEQKITNEELFCDLKETYLNLQKSLLKANLGKQMTEVGKSYLKAKKKIPNL